MTASPTCLRARRRCARRGTAAAKPRFALSPEPRHPRRAAQERKAWWPRLRDYMGKDIMSLMSVPVFIMVKPRRALSLRSASAPARASLAAAKAARDAIRARSLVSCVGLRRCTAIVPRRSPRRCFKRWLRSWNTASCWTRLRSARHDACAPPPARRRRRIAGRRADLAAAPHRTLSCASCTWRALRWAPTPARSARTSRSTPSWARRSSCRRARCATSLSR